jgi:hypothetical protein
MADPNGMYSKESLSNNDTEIMIMLQFTGSIETDISLLASFWYYLKSEKSKFCDNSRERLA